MRFHSLVARSRSLSFSHTIALSLSRVWRSRSVSVSRSLALWLSLSCSFGALAVLYLALASPVSIRAPDRRMMSPTRRSRRRTPGRRAGLGPHSFVQNCPQVENVMRAWLSCSALACRAASFGKRRPPESAWRAARSRGRKAPGPPTSTTAHAIWSSPSAAGRPSSSSRLFAVAKPAATPNTSPSIDAGPLREAMDRMTQRVRDLEARTETLEMAAAQREELLRTGTVFMSEKVPAGGTHVHQSVLSILWHSGRRHSGGSILVCAAYHVDNLMKFIDELVENTQVRRLTVRTRERSRAQETARQHMSQDAALWGMRVEFQFLDRLPPQALRNRRGVGGRVRSRFGHLPRRCVEGRVARKSSVSWFTTHMQGSKQNTAAPRTPHTRRRTPANRTPSSEGTTTLDRVLGRTGHKIHVRALWMHKWTRTRHSGTTTVASTS